jgi:hypothetical protein
MGHKALVVLLALIQYVSAAAVEPMITPAPEIKARATTVPNSLIGYINTSGTCEYLSTIAFNDSLRRAPLTRCEKSPHRTANLAHRGTLRAAMVAAARSPALAIYPQLVSRTL